MVPLVGEAATHLPAAHVQPAPSRLTVRGPDTGHWCAEGEGEGEGHRLGALRSPPPRAQQRAPVLTAAHGALTAGPATQGLCRWDTPATPSDLPTRLLLSKKSPGWPVKPRSPASFLSPSLRCTCTGL